MGRWFAVCLLVTAACSVPRHARRPVAVLHEDEPWSRGCVASATPVFAYYDDGLVVYHDGGSHAEPRYARVVADAGERAVLARALSPGLLELDPMIVLSDHVHEPCYVLHLWSGAGSRTITVYGDLAEGSGGRARCPREFVEAYDVLRGFRSGRATAWRPAHLLVHFTPQPQPLRAGTVRGPRPWPRDWPGLEHPGTRRLGADAFVIRLDATHRDELAALREHPLDSHAAVEIDGRPGLVSWSFAFPCEPTLRGGSGDASE